jgi:hypothetical protein
MSAPEFADGENQDEDIVHAHSDMVITCVRQFGPYPVQAQEY